jgi:hypothetical protein
MNTATATVTSLDQMLAQVAAWAEQDRLLEEEAERLLLTPDEAWESRGSNPRIMKQCQLNHDHLAAMFDKRR